MSNKYRYLVYALIISLIIGIKALIVIYKINQQKADARVINVAGRQRMLSQNITKHASFIQKHSKTYNNRYSSSQLAALVKQFEKAHYYLDSINREDFQINSIDSILKSAQSDVLNIKKFSEKLITSENETKGEYYLNKISEAEVSFLPKMEKIVDHFEKNAASKVFNTKSILLWLTIAAILVIIIEFVVFMRPFFDRIVVNNKLLKEQNIKLADFAQITSHNLRAPVSNLMLLKDMWAGLKTAEEKEHIFDKIETSINHLSETLDVLVNVLIINSSDNTQLQEEVNIEKVLTNTLESLKYQIDETNARILVDLKSKKLVCNKVYLESVFLNLISNAIKYSAIERTPEILVKSTQTGSKIEITVSDNGIGLDLERHRQKLFGLGKKFHRNTDSKGFGLFMTKNQVEAMGGEVFVHKNETQGMTFGVKLNNGLR